MEMNFHYQGSFSRESRFLKCLRNEILGCCFIVSHERHFNNEKRCNSPLLDIFSRSRVTRI